MASAATCLHDLFEDQARRKPHALAIRDGTTSIDYEELDRRANRLASALMVRLPEPGARVGLHVGRGIDAICAILAILKAGHAYVPLEPDYPAPRLEFMARDAQLALVISDRPHKLSDIPSLLVDQIRWLPFAMPGGRLRFSAEMPAYIIYTSGSTGEPKGVIVSHRNVVSLLTACDELFDLRADDVWSLFHSHCFDFSVWEMWGALAHGAQLVVVPQNVARSPRAMLDLLATEHITICNQVPSVFRYLVRQAAKDHSRELHLRYLIFSGEALDAAAVQQWLNVIGPSSTRYVNIYGITETTVFVTLHEIDPKDPMPDAGQVPIGRVLPHLEIAVLTEDRRPVSIGEVGEIYVAGAGVSIGYLGRPQLTAERFPTLTLDGQARRFYRSGDLARWRADGTLDYVGRLDTQVKMRGFRIEPGEVEAILRQVTGIQDVSVVARPSRVGDLSLVAFYVADHDRDHDLRCHASNVLPGHLLPARFVRLRALPLSPSGKTDRHALIEAQL